MDMLNQLNLDGIVDALAVREASPERGLLAGSKAASASASASASTSASKAATNTACTEFARRVELRRISIPSCDSEDAAADEEENEDKKKPSNRKTVVTFAPTVEIFDAALPPLRTMAESHKRKLWHGPDEMENMRDEARRVARRARKRARISLVPSDELDDRREEESSDEEEEEERGCQEGAEQHEEECLRGLEQRLSPEREIAKFIARTAVFKYQSKLHQEERFSFLSPFEKSLKLAAVSESVTRKAREDAASRGAVDLYEAYPAVYERCVAMVRRMGSTRSDCEELSRSIFWGQQRAGAATGHQQNASSNI